MLWFINNIKELKAENAQQQLQLAEKTEQINLLQYQITELEKRVTAVDGGPPTPP